MKRIHAFEQWCYRRILKFSWKDKVSNTAVLKRIREKEPRFYREKARQKLACDGHISRGSGGSNALVILEGQIEGNKAQGDGRECGLTTSGNGQC